MDVDRDTIEVVFEHEKSRLALYHPATDAAGHRTRLLMTYVELEKLAGWGFDKASQEVGQNVVFMLPRLTALFEQSHES